MSLAYVKDVRAQVKSATDAAMLNRVKYTPIFWTGSHLHPVLFGLIRMEAMRSLPGGSRK